MSANFHPLPLCPRSPLFPSKRIHPDTLDTHPTTHVRCISPPTLPLCPRSPPRRPHAWRPNLVAFAPRKAAPRAPSEARLGLGLGGLRGCRGVRAHTRARADPCAARALRGWGAERLERTSSRIILRLRRLLVAVLAEGVGVTTLREAFGWVPPRAERATGTAHDRPRIGTKRVPRTSESIPGSRLARRGP